MSSASYSSWGGLGVVVNTTGLPCASPERGQARMGEKDLSLEVSWITIRVFMDIQALLTDWRGLGKKKVSILSLL